MPLGGLIRNPKSSGGYSLPYWSALQRYKSRVVVEGGTIIDESYLRNEIKFTIDKNVYDKIAYWVDNKFGKKNAVSGLKKPLVCFSTDDGYADDYTVYQIMKSKGDGRGTSFINGININTTGHLTTAQILEMAADGWDFQDHTYSHAHSVAYGGDNITAKLTELSNAEIEEDLILNNAVFEALGLPYPEHFAYPAYQTEFDRITPIIAKYRKSMRGGGTNYISPYTYEGIVWWSYAGGAIGFNDANEVKNLIDAAIVGNQLVHLATHATFTISNQAQFESDLDYIYSKGLKPCTVKEFYNAVNAQRAKLFNVVDWLTVTDYTKLIYYDSGLQTEKQGIIIFNDTLANVGVDVADHFKNLGYNVAFWDDNSSAALEYFIPNNEKYFDGQDVVVDPVADKLTFPMLIGGSHVNILEVGKRIYLTGTTEPGGLSFNTPYYVKAFAGFYAVKLTATSGGAIIDITSAGEGVKVSTFPFRDKLIDLLGIDNCTPKMLAEKTDSIVLGNWSFSGDLNDTGLWVNKMLTNATIIDLGFNMFSGKIPKEFNIVGRYLMYISLLYNNISGGFENLINSKLSRVIVQGNAITDSIPDDIKYCNSSFNSFNVSLNKMVGVIPRNIGYLKNIDSIYLNDNLFSGDIPVEIGNIVSCIRFRFYNNNFTGYETGAISMDLINLIEFNISGNAITDRGVIAQILLDASACVSASSKALTLNVSGGTNASLADISQGGIWGDFSAGAVPSDLAIALKNIDITKSGTVTANGIAMPGASGDGTGFPAGFGDWYRS